MTYNIEFNNLCYYPSSSRENRFVRRYNRETLENVHKTALHSRRPACSQEAVAKEL